MTSETTIPAVSGDRPPGAPLVGAAVLIQLALAALVVLGAGAALPTPVRALWLGGLAIGLALQLWANRCRRALGALAGGGATTALAWGLGPGWWASEAVGHIPLLAILSLVAVTELGLLSGAPPRLFYATLALLLGPLGLGAVQTADGHALMVLTAVLAAALAWAGWGLHRALAAWSSLREQNRCLVQDLVRQKESAEQANVAKSRFLAAASHDLRQPLHALSLFSTALADRIRYPEVRRIVDNIVASVAALEGLFNSLLDVSKLDVGALATNVGNVSLQALFARLDNDYGPQARQKGLEWTLRPCPGVTVRSDAVLLERLLRNLVANAIRYTPAGAVTVTCEPAAGEVQVAVQDTGVGIAPEDLATIFDEYVQLDNPERDRSKGLGLGLAIVDRIARLLGHPMTVQSRPGTGSCFSVTLPRGEGPAAAPAEADPVAEYDLAGLTVLVLDDEAANREAVRVLVQGWGARVREADSVAEACRLAQADGEIDCVLADYRLRDGATGIEALRALQEVLGTGLPALIVTGDVALTRQHPQGIDGYRIVHKPLPPARLRAFLRHALGRRRAARATGGG